jgi:hypothetical protein
MSSNRCHSPQMLVPFIPVADHRVHCIDGLVRIAAAGPMQGRKSGAITPSDVFSTTVSTAPRATMPSIQLTVYSPRPLKAFAAPGRCRLSQGPHNLTGGNRQPFCRDSRVEEKPRSPCIRRAKPELELPSVYKTYRNKPSVTISTIRGPRRGPHILPEKAVCRESCQEPMNRTGVRQKTGRPATYPEKTQGYWTWLHRDFIRCTEGKSTHIFFIVDT